MGTEREIKVGFVILAQTREEIGLKIKDRGETDHQYDQVPTAKAKGKAMEPEGVSKSDGGRGRQPPLSLALSPMVATPLALAFQSNQDQVVIRPGSDKGK